MRIFTLLFLCLLFGSRASAQAKRVRLAAYNLPPYVSAERSEQGYLYDIVHAAFTQAGYQVDVAYFPPLRAKKVVESGERDALIPSYSTTADADTLLFSQPIVESQIGLFRLRDAKQSGSARDKIPVLPQGTDSLFNEEEGVVRSSSDHIVELIEMMRQKKIGVATADRYQVADVLVNRRPKFIGKVEFVEPMLAVKEFHIAFSRKNPASERMLAEFDQALAAMQKNGDYERILLRYGLRVRDSGEKVLNIGTVRNSDIDRIKDLSQVFLQERPGTRINWYILEENLLRRGVLASLAMDDPLFDIITITNYDTAIYAENGWIKPLSPPVHYDVEDVIPSIRTSLSYKNKLHALPFYGESSMTYYRRDLFQAFGLVMPEQPTYEDLRRFARKLHQPEKQMYGICLRGKPGWGENMTLFNIMLNVFGGSWFDAKSRPILTSEAWKETLTFYLELLQNYGPPNAHANGYAENLAIFAEGKCAIWIDATVAASYLMNADVSKVRNTLAFAKAPVMKKLDGNRALAAWALAVTATTKKKDLAQDFVFWATSKKYIQLVAREKGWLAVPPGTRRSTYQSAAYKQAAPFSNLVLSEMENAIRKGAMDVWGHPVRGPQFVARPEYAALGTAVGINIALALQNKISPERALELSQQEARQIMRDP